MTSMKATLATFGRRATVTSPRMLGASPPPPAPAPPAPPACGFGDYMGSAPFDATTNAPSTIGNGVREGLKFAGLLSAGAILGAVISPEKRGRNAAIGGAVGAIAGAGVVLYQYSQWKDQSPGCGTAPAAPPKSAAPPASPPPKQQAPQGTLQPAVAVMLPPPAMMLVPPPPPEPLPPPPEPLPTFTPGGYCHEGQMEGTYDAAGNCVDMMPIVK